LKTNPHEVNAEIRAGHVGLVTTAGSSLKFIRLQSRRIKHRLGAWEVLMFNCFASLLTLGFTLGACSSLPAIDSSLELQAQKISTVNYTASNKDFPNPERGFYADSEYYQSSPNSLSTAQLKTLILEKASAGYQVSLIHRSYFLPEFINTAKLPGSFINTVRQDLQAARGAGVKLILRFAYRTIALEDCNGLPPAEQPACIARANAEHDPTKQTILNHLENLRTVLSSNSDVIAYVDAGLFGTYGEWAYATDQGVGSLLSGFKDSLAPDPQYGYSDGNVPNANTREVIAKFLDILPENRAIAIRTPEQRVMLLEDSFDPRVWNLKKTTITDETAFEDSALARLGAHNDCFLASNDDFGTYYYADYPGVDVAKQIQKEKDYLSVNNLFVPMGGETCAVNADVSSQQFPAYAKVELRKMRWSTLNTDYNQDVLTAMGATLTDAKKNLGYRFVLQSSSVPTKAVGNKNIDIKFTLKNEGYASPYNPHNLEMVFVKNGSAPIRRNVVLNRSSNTDPRFWKPLEVKTVTARVDAPNAAGTYAVYLNLPDPLLKDDARYSLRFANENAWDSSKIASPQASAAFNALNQSIQIR
jgi:Domain of unknown function (DUF4832)/Domain of unknown function (DUF4874)